ncbi:hypothetical protein N7523_000991 [Penicillium sp. IBT 18751x]|nr:hypothetical protein N7523_000991 [Penicillium sp. IBT 18751x]
MDSARQYAPPHTKSKFGPEFKKGPLHEEIYDRRAQGEVIPSNARILQGRSHSIVLPPDQHRYSDPYEKRTQPYTPMMKKEYEEYKNTGDGPQGSWSAYNEEIGKSKDLQIGRRTVPTNEHGRSFVAGIKKADEAVAASNRAGQSRQGFEHKYPQAYENMAAIQTHHLQITALRSKSASYREDQQYLQDKQAKWAARMDKEALPIEPGLDVPRDNYGQPIIRNRDNTLPEGMKPGVKKDRKNRKNQGS